MDKKTVLERFQDIKELEVADDLGTVADVLPYFCKNHKIRHLKDFSIK